MTSISGSHVNPEVGEVEDPTGPPFTTSMRPVSHRPLNCRKGYKIMSIRKVNYAFVATLVAITSAFPQVATAPIPIVAKDVTFEPSNRVVSFGLENRGGREVTAFGYLLTVLNGGREMRHGEYTDLLPLIGLRDFAPVSPSDGSSFRPGETYTVRFVAPAEWGDVSRATFSVQPTMAIDDSNAALGDAAGIERIRRGRSDHAEAVFAFLDRLSEARASGDSRRGLNSAMTRLKAEAPGANHPKRDLQVSFVTEALRVYERSGDAGLDTLEKAYRAQAIAMREGSNVSERKER
jgi:hypothetical protein